MLKAINAFLSKTIQVLISYILISFLDMKESFVRRHFFILTDKGRELGLGILSESVIRSDPSRKLGYPRCSDPDPDIKITDPDPG